MAARDELEKLRRLKELESRIPSKRRGMPVIDDKFKAQASFSASSKPEQFGTGFLAPFAKLGLFTKDMVGDLSPEDLSMQQRLKAIKGGAGGTGEFVGEMAATAPLGVLGKGAEAIAAVRKVPSVLKAALNSRTAQAAGEGAVSAAMMADSGERGDAAGIGAMLGPLAERVGAGFGRLGQGLVKQSPEAQQLRQVADLHGADVKLPLSVAASDDGVISPLMKFIYGKVLPNLPGAEGSLQKQSQRANAQFREIAMKESAPGGMGSTQPGYSGGLPLTTNKASGAGSNMRSSMKDIQDAFEREYADTVKSYVFNKPDSNDLANRLRAKFPNIDDASLNGVVAQFDQLANRFAKNGILDGDNLIRMKTRLAHMGREAGEERIGQSFFQAQEFLDDVVRQELSQGGKGQNLIDLQRYEDLAEPWRNFQRVQKATARSKDPTGQFTSQELNRAVKTMSGDAALARGSAPMQELATIGEQTVGQKMHSPTFLERGMTMATLGGAGLLGGAPAVAALWGIGRTAASPAVQDVLMGTNSTQEALMRALRNNPKTTRYTGAALRNTLAAEAVDDE